MRRVVPAILGLLAISAAPAVAADLPAQAPPMVPVMAPAFSWSGFYIGGNAGVAINDSRYNIDPSGCFVTTACGFAGLAGNASRTDSGKFNRDAFTGGGQIGYNWQFAPNWLFGLETDLNYNGTNASATVSLVQPPAVFGPGSTFNYSLNQKIDWFGTGRVRLGWVPADRVMIYGTGGVAYGHVSSSTGVFFPTSTDQYAGSLTDTRLGWTAGGGVEWAFAQNWTAKAEYLYVDLGSITYTSPCLSPAAICAVGPSFQTTLNNREHIIRFGINYLFNAGGPVVAKY